jgi:serine/threonine protein kinase
MKRKREYAIQHGISPNQVVIGEGTYGIVYKEGQYAYKVLKQPVGTMIFSVFHEIYILGALKHDNIVKLISVKYSPSPRLQFELLDQNLRVYMNKNLDKPIEMPVIKGFLRNMLSALSYCCTKGVLRRDIKPENLLLTNTTLKIADFGLSTIIKPSQFRSMTRNVVTVWYRAPEIMLGDTKYGFPIDIWAVGIIFAELLRNKLWQYDNEIQVMFDMFLALGTPNEIVWPGVTNLPDFSSSFPNWRGEKNPFPAFIGDSRDLLVKMLRYDPNTRISAYDALDHAYFKVPI